MKTYLSKSNHSDPELVALVRKYLTNLGHEIVEFTGGAYTNNPLLNSNYLIVVPPSKVLPKRNNVWSHDYSADPYNIGKGQTEQIKEYAINKSTGSGTNNHIEGLSSKLGPTIWSNRIYCVCLVNPNKESLEIKACPINGYLPFPDGNWQDMFSEVSLGVLKPLDCLLPACVELFEEPVETYKLVGVTVDWADNENSHLAAVHMFPGII